MKDLHLIQFEGNSFMGIDSESPVIIDFTQARKNQGITLLKGDQGTRKSSTLTALMNLMGAVFNFDTKNFVNQKDETIDENLKFHYDGADWHVIQSGNRLSLKRYYKETDRWIQEGSPKETLRKIFGSLGVSPMFLKELPGKKQIEWFKETFGSDEEASKKEIKKTAELKTVFDQRREVNRVVKDLKGWLNESKLYNNYEANQKKFAKPITGEKEKARLEELGNKYTEYNKALSGLSTLKGNEKIFSDRVKELELQLNAAKVSLADMQDRIKKGEQYVSENKGIEKEYEAANEAWLSLGKTLAEQNSWKEVLKKEKEYNEAVEASQHADSTIDKLRQQLLEIVSTYLPKIDGLEIRVKTMSLDNGDEDEGIYFRNKSLAQLSESEVWDLFLCIWEKKGVQFVFCENINALGSEAVKTINRLVKEKKAQIFASEVDRSKNEMEISFTTKIN